VNIIIVTLSSPFLGYHRSKHEEDDNMNGKQRDGRGKHGRRHGHQKDAQGLSGAHGLSGAQELSLNLSGMGSGDTRDSSVIDGTVGNRVRGRKHVSYSLE